MKFVKITRLLLLALSLMMVTNNTNSMEPFKEGDWTTFNELPTRPFIISRLLTENRWITTVAHIMLGIGSMETLWSGMEDFEFTQLPSDTQNEIKSLLLMGENSKTLIEAASIINALAQVNKELNELINNYDFSVQIVKNLANRFNSTEEEVCLALHTKAAKEYLASVQLLNNIISQRVKKLSQTDLQILNNNDLNFRFHSFGDIFGSGTIYPLMPGGGSILMYAYFHNCVDLQNILLTIPTIDYNLPNKEGKTTLMISVDGRPFVTNINGAPLDPLQVSLPTVAFLNNYPHVAINQKDLQGNTALLIALETEQTIKGKMQIIKNIAQVKVTKKPKTPNSGIIRALLDAGADPELANNEGLTPLQAAIATDNQNIVQMIQDAIIQKHAL